MPGPTKAELQQENEALKAENAELKETANPSRTGAKQENIAKPPVKSD